jgi:hypothetical protein
MSSARLFGIAALAALASAVALGGCKKDEEKALVGEALAAAAPASAAAPAAGEAPLEIVGTGCELTPPAGWDKDQKDPWTILTSKPDDKGNVAAIVAFVTFNQPNESTAKLGTLASVLSLHDIRWGGRENVELPAGFPATGASGTCKDSENSACEIHYLTINPGGSEQILFVYAVDSDQAKALEPTVVESLKSLKRK